MAKTRVVNTRFWVDDYISNLDPIEKLLFLYFLTNPSTDICGIYEIPLKTIAVDTGIDKEMVEKVLKRFKRDKKIVYKNGWVGIKNFIKHQSVNPSIEKGIEIGLKRAPQELVDSLSEPEDSLLHLNLNSNLNSNTKSKNTYGEFKKVFLTEEEYQKLTERMGEKNTLILIEELDSYIASKNKKYSSHYATILTWARRKVADHKKIKSNVAF